MKDKAIYTSAQRKLSVAFQDIIAHNSINQPVLRKNLRFDNGECILDLTDPEQAVYEPLMDNHPQNIKNGGSASTGFKKQKEDTTRLQILADGEVYCSMPDDGLTDADSEAIEYLMKMARVLPPTALKNTTEKAIFIYERFGFAGLPRPKKGQKVAIVKARVTEMMEALVEHRIWITDDDTKGASDTGETPEED